MRRLANEWAGGGGGCVRRALHPERERLRNKVNSGVAEGANPKRSREGRTNKREKLEKWQYKIEKREKRERERDREREKEGSPTTLYLIGLRCSIPYYNTFFYSTWNYILSHGSSLRCIILLYLSLYYSALCFSMIIYVSDNTKCVGLYCSIVLYLVAWGWTVG